MKISFITTVFNEEKTIKKFLDSLFAQTLLPDEIIIVDGGSKDKTVPVLEKYVAKSKKDILTKILIKPGNRSVGRNEAIKNAKNTIIVCSDSGNILDKNWIKNIVKPFKEKKVDVVAGYYKGLAKNIFQKCLVPFALVMEDKINPGGFLPATRSIAFTKKIWEKIGGFPEQFSHNEDYVFAKRLEKARAKIIFAKDAIVYWLPRNSFKDAFVMFFRFALGDAEAGIIRSKVVLLFTRYLLGFYFVFLTILYKSFPSLSIITFLFLLYILWTVVKNYRYVKSKQAFVFLPLLQFTADAAVISGTSFGLLKRFIQFRWLTFIRKNIFFISIISIYILLMSQTISWGIPNINHPFPYQMDEWHQLQAVANTFRYGTPNTAGSANGTMFHFLLSGLYLIPFTLIQYINPFALQIDNSVMRERVFEILRLNTIGWGVLSLTVLYFISKLLKLSHKFVLTFFVFTPFWLILSGYFKYDIALLFWILLSLLLLLQFAKEPSQNKFYLAAIPVSLAIAVKVSAIPLLVLYNFSYFWFTAKKNWNLKHLLIGNNIFIVLLMLFGFPDMLFGKGNIFEYLYDNLVRTPSLTTNFLINTNVYLYLFGKQYPNIFGYGLLLVFVSSLAYYIWLFISNGLRPSFKKYKIELFLLFSFFCFLLSILPLKIYAGGNRSLVLLPFFVLISALTLKRLQKELILKKFLIGFLICALTLQLWQSFTWFSIKLNKSPQETASVWINKHIPQKKIIGIENIPIYQFLPNLVEKEFYFNEYHVAQNNKFIYQIVDKNTKQLPEYVIVTNEIEDRLLVSSPKKDLLHQLEKEEYVKLATFTPHMDYYTLLFKEEDFFISGVLTTPTSISVFRQSQNREEEK